MGKRRRKHEIEHNRVYYRNEHAIQKAILTLLGSYRGRLTARQVAKAARLSRQTVYNHHKNINCAIEEGEKAILEAFPVELGLQSQKLVALIPDNNTRLFYAMLIFMANRRDVFVLLCSDGNNQRTLFNMINMLVPMLAISWSPKNAEVPESGSDRVDMMVAVMAAVIRKWATTTCCDIKKANHCINRLLRAANDAAINRLP